jgi:hypothetical protein
MSRSSTGEENVKITTASSWLRNKQETQCCSVRYDDDADDVGGGGGGGGRAHRFTELLARPLGSI